MNCGLSGSELSNAVTSHSYASVARCRFHTSRNTVPTHHATSTVPTVSAHSLSLPRLQKHCTYIHASEPALCQLYRHTHCRFHASRNTVPTPPANHATTAYRLGPPDSSRGSVLGRNIWGLAPGERDNADRASTVNKLSPCATQPTCYSLGCDRQRDGQRDRQTDGRNAASLNAPYEEEHNNRPHLLLRIVMPRNNTNILQTDN